MGITWKSEEWVGFSGNADANEGCLRLVVDFGFPVVNFILLWYGKIALNAAF